MRRKIQWDERGADDKNDEAGVIQHVTTVVRKTVYQPAKVIAVLFYLFLITYKAHIANFSRLVGVLLLYSLTRLEMPALNHIGG